VKSLQHVVFFLAPFLALRAQEPAPAEPASPEGPPPPAAAEHPIETDALREPRLAIAGRCLIQNVTIHSAVRPAYVGDVLIKDGDIAAIGTGLEAPEGVPAIDATGKHLAPGVIDTHSHLAIHGGVNEGTLSITADCDISDAIDPEDLGLYRALAGGVTTIQCLHGSANTIGGRSEVLKLRYGARADELRFPGAPQGIKFALGENVKRSNWGEPGERFPSSRGGVEAVFERAFRRAEEYHAEWQAYEAARAKGEDPAAPRRDVRLDVLVGVLAGNVLVHSHCYTASEILMLLRTAERFGFRIQTLQHVLEGYKVAHEIALHGAGPSTFSDWWAYKIEAYDAIGANAALMDEAGAVTTINSDSEELIRHLYHEAAKSIRYAGLDRVRTLALATLNGAKQLGVADRVGSIEVGKDADLVLLDADPLSVYAKVLWTMVDGVVEFERRDAFGLDGAVIARRSAPEEPPRRAIEAAAGAPAGPLTAIVGGTLHTITAGDLENATLVLQEGRIQDLGAGIAIPAGAIVIDATDKHVWPGLIALNTPLGLREVDSVRATLDDGEARGDQPDLRVASALNPESAHIPVTRTSGITRAQSTPRSGGPIRGQSALIRLAGETYEDLLTLDRDMLHVAFPHAKNGEGKKDEEPPEEIEELKRLFLAAKEHGRLIADAREHGTLPPSFNSRLEALAPFASGAARVALHADNAQTILYALKFAGELELDAVLYGCGEGWKVAERIAAAGYPVVVGPVLAVPSSAYDPYDACYANPALLLRAGVDIALMSADAQNPRNLVDHAGMAVAFGLPYEEALRAITLDPARVLGLERDFGSLEPGKVADVIITDGDLLETATRVECVLIDGVQQDLANKQTKLYDQYRARLQRLQGEAGTGTK
jgi:imidazolonepropionase-like amidohydrolase